MIRWYDYGAAFLMADALATMFFTIPFFGAVLAYLLYEYGWGWYCNYTCIVCPSKPKELISKVQGKSWSDDMAKLPSSSLITPVVVP